MKSFVRLRKSAKHVDNDFNSIILETMKEKYIALIRRANNPFIVLGRFTGIAKARNFAHQKNIKFYSIMSEKEWRTAAEFYAEHA
jgi:hypothetical protein